MQSHLRPQYPQYLVWHNIPFSIARMVFYLLWSLFTKYVPFDLVDNHIRGCGRFPLQPDFASGELGDLQVARRWHLYWEAKGKEDAQVFFFPLILFLPTTKSRSQVVARLRNRWQENCTKTGQMSSTSPPYTSPDPKWQKSILADWDVIFCNH